MAAFWSYALFIFGVVYTAAASKYIYILDTVLGKWLFFVYPPSVLPCNCSEVLIPRDEFFLESKANTLRMISMLRATRPIELNCFGFIKYLYQVGYSLRHQNNGSVRFIVFFYYCV